jgi:hypothetical protein
MGRRLAPCGIGNHRRLKIAGLHRFQIDSVNVPLRSLEARGLGFEAAIEQQARDQSVLAPATGSLQTKVVHHDRHHHPSQQILRLERECASDRVSTNALSNVVPHSLLQSLGPRNDKCRNDAVVARGPRMMTSFIIHYLGWQAGTGVPGTSDMRMP